jgi:hypothetical protein
MTQKCGIELRPIMPVKSDLKAVVSYPTSVVQGAQDRRAVGFGFAKLHN